MEAPFLPHFWARSLFYRPVQKHFQVNTKRYVLGIFEGNATLKSNIFINLVEHTITTAAASPFSMLRQFAHVIRGEFAIFEAILNLVSTTHAEESRWKLNAAFVLYTTGERERERERE